MLTLLLRHLLIIFHRELTRKYVLKNEYLDHEMDTAASYFNENYNRDINIEEYAVSRGMSVSWFIRNFKKFTGTTPMQFITSIRITNAQMLLETTNYAVNEMHTLSVMITHCILADCFINKKAVHHLNIENF